MLVVLTLSLLISAQEPAPLDECRAEIDRLEVRRAIRTGAADNIIEAAELVDQCEGRAELLVLATQTAWEENDLEAVSLLGSAALRLVSDRQCAWAPLAARLAFAVGFARLGISERGEEFYFYTAWVIDRENRALPRDWRHLSEHYAEEFGTYPPDDIFAFGSPFIQRPYVPDEDTCGALPQFNIRFDGAVDDFAFTIFDLNTRRDGEVRTAREVVSYPGPLNEEIFEQMRGRMSHDLRYDNYHSLVIAPCVPDWFIIDDGPPICLPGYVENVPTAPSLSAD